MEPVGGVLASVEPHQLVELEPAAAFASDERLRDEPDEQREVYAGHLLGRMLGETTVEDREARQCATLALGQQPPAVRQDGTDAAVPFRQIAQRRGEQVE